MKNVIKEEPLVSTGVVVSVIILLLRAFQVDVTQDMEYIIAQFAEPLAQIISVGVTVLAARFFVSPSWKVPEKE